GERLGGDRSGAAPPDRRGCWELGSLTRVTQRGSALYRIASMVPPPRRSPIVALTVESAMIRLSPPKRTVRRRGQLRIAYSIASAVVFAATALPLAAQQGVEQQGWNPKEILASEHYVKPPAVVERIVSAPRNSVTFTNPSPDHRYFLKAESEGLPTIEAFGKPHYRLSTGFEVDFKANRARALTTRGSIGLTLIDPQTGSMRTIETPKGAIVNGATWSPDGKSIAYIASFDASTQIFVADVASGKSVQITTKPLLATRVTTLDWTSNGKAISTVLIPDNRGAEPAEGVAKGPEIRT